MAKRYLGGGISFEQKDVYQEFSEDEGGGGSSTLAGLTDVDISNPTNGDTLVYNSTSEKWENGEGGGGSTTLAGLTDVDISNPTDGQTLVYNATSGKWENGEGGGGGFTLLHGTYSYDEVEEKGSVTLPYTASELYPMVRSSYVAFDYAITHEGESTTRTRPITSASLAEVEGDVDSYIFLAGEAASGWILAADSVVFAEIYD